MSSISEFSSFGYVLKTLNFSFSMYVVNETLFLLVKWLNYFRVDGSGGGGDMGILPSS